MEFHNLREYVSEIRGTSEEGSMYFLPGLTCAPAAGQGQITIGCHFSLSLVNTGSAACCRRSAVIK